MNNKKLWILINSCILVMLLFAACSTYQFITTPTPTPTPTSASTIFPTETKPIWEFIAFGDSRTKLATWPTILVGYIEKDLDIEVHLNNIAASGQTSEELLGWLQTSEHLREQVSEARIMTILTMDEAGYANFTYDNFSDYCSSDQYQIILEGILNEIFTLRGNNPLIIHLLEHYNYPGSSEHSLEFFNDRKACFELYNDSVHAVAEKYNIPIVPVYAVFNGIDGFDNPDDKGYLSDGVHLSPAGDVVIADLFRELGYNPIIP